MTHATPTDTQQPLRTAVVHMQAGILALTCGILFGFGLFVMTIWLVIRGGLEVGPHLGLLGYYFPGYSVTWGGAFLGLFYGALVGAVVGAAIAFVYNRVAALRSTR